MKLLKVSVPNFRNLQNVELVFEPTLKPAVFPIASDNGGGKSTLLQLIFVLLHCSLDEERFQFIENFLSASKVLQVKDQIDKYDIASLEISYKDNKIDLDFYLMFRNSENNEDYSAIIEYLSAIESYQQIKEEFDLNEARALQKQKDEKKRKEEERKYLQRIGLSSLLSPGELMPNLSTSIMGSSLWSSKPKSERDKIKDKLDDISETIKKGANYQKNHNIFVRQIIKLEKQQPILFIGNTNCDNYDLVLEALEFARDHVYLAIPSTQPCLFLDQKSKKELLSELGEYKAKLSELREKLPQLYIYNQLAIAGISKAFIKARDKDIIKFLDNLDEYDTKLKDLIEDFHQFLGNDKYIFPTKDFNSIIVRRQISDNEFIDLEPEDLSHGELKRLGLYAWIKYNNINDSLILLDEIENSLHPDWQYNIVEELASWGDNQYLLATHSYHLCQALTPRHVKEIEPKLSVPVKQ